MFFTTNSGANYFIIPCFFFVVFFFFVDSRDFLERLMPQINIPLTEISLPLEKCTNMVVKIGNTLILSNHIEIYTNIV